MIRRVTAITLALLMLTGAALARSVDESFGAAVVDGGNADRVHLRQSPSVDAPSLGLYFTGAEALYEYDTAGDWSWVIIGSEAGYMKSEYLRVGEYMADVVSKQPVGYAASANGGNINLRAEPTTLSAVAGSLSPGEAVTVLGETASKWYCVRRGDAVGYVRSDLLTLGGVAAKSYDMLLYAASPTPGSDIRVQYPRFNTPGMDGLNALIKGKATGFADETYEAYGDVALSLDYRCEVTLLTDRLVSMVFWGDSYVEGGAHPTTDLVALTVDIPTLKELAFSDMYVPDADFERMFFACARFPSAPVTSYDAGRFAEMLAMQTEEFQGVSAFSPPEAAQCFLKPDGVVVSLYAVHATGSDHFEAQLAYEDAQPYCLLPWGFWQN